MGLQGKTAIITGISRGIGKALAQHLLYGGATVAGWGKTPPDYQHTNLHFFPCNVRNMQEVEQAAAATTDKLGSKIDVLINNAGLGYFGYLEEMPPEQFFEVFEVNVYGTYHACRSIIPLMKQQGSGHIVNISSIAGLEGHAQSAAYCGAKHAVRGMTDSLFRELREFNIKVTGIYPGSVKTEFFDNSPGIEAHDYMMSPDEVAASIVNALKASPNFLVNEMVLRPLQTKPPKR